MKSLLRLLLATALSVALLPPAAANTVSVAGIDFPPQAQVGKEALVLQGAGVRTRLTFKVYAFGLYLPQVLPTADAIIDANGAKRIRIIAIRKLEADQFADALLTGLQKNHDAATLAMLQPAIDALLETVRGVGTATPGTEITIDRLANGATRVSVAGAALGSDIAERALYPALLRIWLGAQPADAELKKNVLHHAE